MYINVKQYYNNNNIEQISKLNETEYTLFNIRLKTKLKMPEGLKTLNVNCIYLNVNREFLFTM